MLCQINIQDFAIVKNLELSFSQGMSCITLEKLAQENQLFSMRLDYV